MSQQAILPRFGIAGMGCGLGFASSIDELEHTIYDGVTPTILTTCSANGHGPRGAAEHALRDAAYAASGQQLPIAIVTVQGTAVGDIATQWNLAGPTFDMPDTGWALAVTQLLLADEALEAVLVAGGAAAVVCVRADAPGRIYARVDAVKTHGGSSVAVGAAARSALAAAGTKPEQIDHVELHLSGDCDGDRQALSALSQVWSLDRLCRTAISTFGERGTGRSSLLLSLIKAALCLHYGYLPPWTDRHDDDVLAIRGTDFSRCLRAVRACGRHEANRCARRSVELTVPESTFALSCPDGRCVGMSWRWTGGVPAARHLCPLGDQILVICCTESDRRVMRSTTALTCRPCLRAVLTILLAPNCAPCSALSEGTPCAGSSKLLSRCCPRLIGLNGNGSPQMEAVMLQPR